MDSADRAQQSFNRLRDRRIAARDALSPTLRQLYDTSLSKLLFDTLHASVYSSVHHIRIRPIIRLLNKGATASNLHPNELKGPNLGDLVDVLEDKSINPQLVFRLLDHIIASPCASWSTNRRYVGNGGLPLPYFLISSVATADMWGCCSANSQQSMYNRFRAWCSLRKMVWAYESDMLANRLPTCREAFLAMLLSEFLRDVSMKERNFSFSDPEMRLFDSVVEFFKARYTTLLSEDTPQHYFSCLGPFATELLLRVDGQLFRKYYQRYTAEEVFNRFLMNKIERRMTLKLLSYQDFRKWILGEDCVRELCRRKERVLFEELYLRDSEGLMVMIPFALSLLESHYVRGCKRRLIEMLRGILAKEVIDEGME